MSDKVALFLFWAKWSHPCRLMRPIYEKQAADTPEVEFYSVDVEDHQKIARTITTPGVCFN
jgi:thiol-disulfide isomerase/thioredoxin